MDAPTSQEGPEKYALFEHNLAVASVPHPLMLGDDVEAAGFWLPGFTGFHHSNLAVSCPVGWKLNVQPGAGKAQTGLAFFNNSAHLCGFGWRLFPPHQPRTHHVFTTFTVRARKGWVDRHRNDRNLCALEIRRAPDTRTHKAACAHRRALRPAHHNVTRPPTLT
jgi:hypothetical protein